jgi:hypothetical protein
MSCLWHATLLGCKTPSEWETQNRNEQIPLKRAKGVEMTRRIVAIAFIFICTSVAWAVLGGTIFSRTYSLDDIGANRVASTWGTPQNQAPPIASFKQIVERKEESTENGKKIVKTIKDEVTNWLPLESSVVDVALDLEHRQKGLLWYSTYKVGFNGDYGFRNTSDKEQEVTFVLNFPAAKAIYDDLIFNVDNVPVRVTNEANAALGRVKLQPGQIAHLAVGYRSQGLDEWRYSFGNNDVAQVKDFTLKMKTNFKTSISPITLFRLPRNGRRTTVGS